MTPFERWKQYETAMLLYEAMGGTIKPKMRRIEHRLFMDYFKTIRIQQDDQIRASFREQRKKLLKLFTLEDLENPITYQTIIEKLMQLDRLMYGKKLEIKYE